jgi:hypothetical protein
MSRADYEIKGNPIKLLDAIEEHVMSYMENKYDALIVLESLKKLFSLRQREDEDLVNFTQQFKSAIDVAESHIGEKLRFMKLAKADEEWTSIDADIQEECCKRAYGKVIALLYMMNSDQTKYGLLLSGLSTYFALKQDQYPKSITHATSILRDHKFDESYYAMCKKCKEKVDTEKEKAKGQQLTSDPELNFPNLKEFATAAASKGTRVPNANTTKELRANGSLIKQKKQRSLPKQQQDQMNNWWLPQFLNQHQFRMLSKHHPMSSKEKRECLTGWLWLWRLINTMRTR